MSNIVIDLAAEFTGKKAFRQADTATAKLTKGVGNLAKGLGLAFSGAAIARFAKNSVNAFSQDQKAATRLLQAVDNLGMGFEKTRITDFISNLEKTASVADDDLRPAFQALLSTTGSVSKSQDMLKLALDISAGSGESLTTVAQDLSLAYIGTTKGLKKYNTGLTAAELSTAGFEKIQNKLNDQYTGQNAKRLTTYQGQIDALNIAYGNMRETIGQGLLDSFSLLAGDAGIGGATTAMDNFARFTSDAIYGLTALLAIKPPASKSSFWDIIVGTLTDPIKYGPVGQLSRYGTKLQEAKRLATPIQKNAAGVPVNIAMSNADVLRAKFEKEAIARAKLLADSQKKTLKAHKDALALAKAKRILELETIQITAALKGKISEEDRLALKLQLALLNENADEATKLSEKLITLKEENAKLATKITELPKAANPFAEWPTFIQTALAGIQDGSMTVIEKISAAVAASITLTNTAAQDSLKAGIAAGNSLAEALSGSRYAAQAAAGYAGSADALAASLKAKEDTIAASNAKILADAQATQDALNKINTTKVVVPTGSTAAANAVAADAGTGNAAATIAQVATVVATIAGDSAEATATLAEVATVIATIVADSSATTTGSTAAANAAAADTVEVVTSGLAEIDAAAAALAATAAATAQATADLAAQAAANAAQVAADAADAAGAPNGTTVVVNVAGTVTSEVDLSAFIFDVITSMGVTGNQTVINNRSFATAD